MKEIWKEIEGFDMYEVSNLGRVRNTWTGNILSPHIKDSGYCSYCLRNNDYKTKTVLAHRLLAIAFIPNPDNLPQVNHIDFNKENNCVDNLEWCDREQNMAHYFKKYYSLKSNNI